VSKNFPGVHCFSGWLLFQHFDARLGSLNLAIPLSTNQDQKTKSNTQGRKPQLLLIKNCKIPPTEKFNLVYLFVGGVLHHDTQQKFLFQERGYSYKSKHIPIRYQHFHIKNGPVMTFFLEYQFSNKILRQFIIFFNCFAFSKIWRMIST